MYGTNNIKYVSTSQKTHCVFNNNDKTVMLYRGKIRVYSENNKKHISTDWAKRRFVNVLHIDTTVLNGLTD
jgi:hypothetical protein